MPGFYPENEYDIAGFSVGAVDKSKIIDNTAIKEGDAIIALPSSGVHSNGFSLVRKVFDIENCKDTELMLDLLTPTKIYVKPVLNLLRQVKVKGISHITGGGFYENIPRSLPKGFSAKIKKSDVRVLPIFDRIAKTGKIDERDMFNTFNMGVGMSITVGSEDADNALKILKENGEDAYFLGETVKSDEGVIIC